MNKSVIIAIASALVLTVASQAGEGGKNPEGRPPRRPGEGPLVPPRLVEKLNLTDAQKAKLKDLEADFDKERDKLLASKKDQLAQLDEQAKAARKADNEAQLKEIRKQRMELLKPLMDLRKQSMDKFRATLTDDQKKTMEEARENFKERRGKDGHGPKAPPPGE